MLVRRFPASHDTVTIELAQRDLRTQNYHTKASILDFEPPKSITRMCEKCGKETTWSLRAADAVGYKTFAITCDTAGYTCVLCDDLSLLVIYRNSDWKQTKSGIAAYAHRTVFKIGHACD